MIINWAKFKLFDMGYREGYLKAKIESEIDIQVSEDLIDRLEQRVSEMKSVWFVNKSKVLVVEPSGTITIGGNPMTKQELAILKSEVQTFRNFSYWKIVEETIKQKAIEKSVVSSNVTDIKEQNLELLAGKMMIHNLGIIKSIGDLIEKVV
jgi:hypothetical protein